jgi:hypothetical protein
MKRAKWICVLVLLLPAVLRAQAAVAGDEERGWSFAQRFQGSTNSAGVILKTNSTLFYQFNQHFEMYGGVPVYFARQSSANSTTGSPRFMNGIGNVFTGLSLSADSPTLNFTSDLVATAPTGDKDRGFSTGHATVDWTNTLSRGFENITPFASVGLANTVSDTAFFVRPFSSNGAVAHFEGGALIGVLPRTSIGGSAYAVRASGDQQIVSKVRKQPTSTTSTTAGRPTTVGQARGVFETQTDVTGSAAIANDHGFSTWLTLRPSATSDIQVGYSRSVSYQLDSLFFGIGFRVGR